MATQSSPTNFESFFRYYPETISSNKHSQAKARIKIMVLVNKKDEMSRKRFDAIIGEVTNVIKNNISYVSPIEECEVLLRNESRLSLLQQVHLKCNLQKAFLKTIADIFDKQLTKAQ